MKRILRPVTLRNWQFQQFLRVMTNLLDRSNSCTNSRHNFWLRLLSILALLELKKRYIQRMRYIDVYIFNERLMSFLFYINKYLQLYCQWARKSFRVPLCFFDDFRQLSEQKNTPYFASLSIALHALPYVIGIVNFWNKRCPWKSNALNYHWYQR